jgi:DNA-binding helix-hairpin-helix protein with protein kinase domain
MQVQGFLTQCFWCDSDRYGRIYFVGAEGAGLMRSIPL